MKIVSWNVNSIRARMESFLRLTEEYTPDVILLQETRVSDELFPVEYVEECGYNLAIKGQKGRNGVAICSKHILEEVKSDFSEDARYIEAFTGGVFIASVYVPNGQEVDTEQYYYKLDFLNALKGKFLDFKDETFVAGGDFNVGPCPKDIYIDGFNGVAGTEREREAIRGIREAGFYDVLNDKGFTWWSYRQQSYKKDNGFRIDHFYLSEKTQKLFSGGEVLRNVREFERPSDHAPILCELKDL